MRRRSHIPAMTFVAEKHDRKSWLRRQRAKRIAAEIALLERMDWRLWRAGLLCFSGLFLAAAGIIFIGAEVLGQYYLEPVGFQIGVFVACLFGTLILYWIWRYPASFVLVLGFLALGLLIAAILDGGDVDIPDIGVPDYSSNDHAPDRKELLRRRVQRALEKRRALLAKLTV